MKQPTLFAGAAFLLWPALAWSQPDINNAPKVENPPNRAPGARGRRRGNRQMTPAQRQQLTAQLIETRTKRALTAAGFTDAAVQNAVVDFIQEQASAREELQAKSAQIRTALQAQVVTDAQLAALLNNYRALSDEEAARRKKSLVALDAQIGFSAKPRLDALLLLAGITGEQIPMPIAGGGGFGGAAGQARGGGFGALVR
ncbi:hypothetical protein B1R32_11665 [Abditibacterium utsteinense]|uniref:Periplasmic heavy metal sensor n=1 Tax=Abditibacterium utsteinense TaxID=1960156 RepID=A0A2S8SQM6_9BACT|nr:hypothetical protein [Abditibacterium utsteinense]PQV63088.1 hypothetical protein B1R32_11665 [Abditibacterium utsteinense]